MNDLISRAAAIEICKSIMPNTNPDFYNLKSKAGYGSWMHKNGEACAITSIEIEIEKLPAVDAVSVVHGRWIECVPGDGFPYCSNCKRLALDEGLFLNPKLMKWHRTPYCPYCGAKMDGEQEAGQWVKP